MGGRAGADPLARLVVHTRPSTHSRLGDVVHHARHHAHHRAHHHALPTRPAASRRGRLLAAATAALLLPLAACTPSTGTGAAGTRDEGSRASTASSDPGPPWSSGIWLGGALSDGDLERFGAWRGDPADVVTTYPAYATWEELRTSDWHVDTVAGFPGRLSYGLPLLPERAPGTLRDVADGAHDDVWRSVARTLVAGDRGDSFVRIGLEANGTWFPWGATAATAPDFVAAYRHVATVMAQEAPDLSFVFDISCGAPLRGAEDDRLSALTRLYPGDDVVDVVGCDHYDSFTARATDRAAWEESIRPSTGVGLLDLVDFATEHDKPFAVPEWGLTARSADGSGDNPYFVEQMFAFFREHRDRLAYENYFDEPNPYLGSSLFLTPAQNPESSEVYRELW